MVKTSQFQLKSGLLDLFPSPSKAKQRCHGEAVETFEEMFCYLVLCYEIVSVATDTIRVAPGGKLGKKYRK